MGIVLIDNSSSQKVRSWLRRISEKQSQGLKQVVPKREISVTLKGLGRLEVYKTFWLHQQNIYSCSTKYQQFINSKTKNINHLSKTS